MIYIYYIYICLLRAKGEISRRTFKLSKDVINYLLPNVDSLTWRIYFVW